MKLTLVLNPVGLGMLGAQSKACKTKLNFNFKSVGQECPTHTGYVWLASFEGMLLLEFGQGGSHVRLKFFCLRHQGRIG